MEDRMHFLSDPSACMSIFGMFDGHGGQVRVHRNLQNQVQYVSDYLECYFGVSIRDRLLKFERKRTIELASTTPRDPIADVRIRLKIPHFTALGDHDRSGAS